MVELKEEEMMHIAEKDILTCKNKIAHISEEVSDLNIAHISLLAIVNHSACSPIFLTFSMNRMRHKIHVHR